MTLTQAAGLTKKFILISLILSVLGITSFIGYKIWHARYLASLPPVEEKPDMKFGALPALNLPKSNVSSSNFSYSLDTTTGNLPNFPKIAKVFFMPKIQSSFLSPEKSTDLAEKFNLKVPPEIISETKYQYKDKSRSLLINLDTGDFSYKEESTSAAKPTPEQDDKRLIDSFKNFLSEKLSLPKEIKNGFAKVTRNPDNKMAVVDVWPQNINERRIITPAFSKEFINALVAGQGSDLENYFSINYIFHPIDQTTFATYPIKSANMAFNELRSGQARVIIEPPKPQVSITSVYLAYYQSEDYQPFLQPVIVFEGVNFAAYLDAIAR